jgi:hypothetical protein
VIKKNGCCSETGWDYYEEDVRKEFLEYAPRSGLDITTNKECPWEFEDSVTNKVWRAYHTAHVRGREFKAEGFK